MLGFILSAALGGAIGASLRYLTTLLVQNLFGAAGLWNASGTLAVNVIGSFIMGGLFVLFAEKLNFFGAFNAHWRVFLMTGVLGGFTTFSAFSLEAWQMIERQAYIGALSYIALSFILSIGALILAIYIIRSVS